MQLIAHYNPKPNLQRSTIMFNSKNLCKLYSKVKVDRPASHNPTQVATAKKQLALLRGVLAHAA